jgi:MFS family permease
MAFFTAMQMQFVLRGFLAWELTRSAVALASIGAAISIPMLIIAPFGGVLADRLNKRTVLIVSQSVGAIFVFALALLVITDRVEFWHLFVTSAGTGVIFSFNMPARQALVPLLVPQHKLMNAVSLQMGGQNLTRIIAPAAGGLLIAPLGLGWVFMVTAAMFLLAVASEYRLPKHGLGGEKRERDGIFEDLAGGFRYVRGERLVVSLLVTASLVPLLTFPAQMLLPIFADQVFNDPDGKLLGFLAAASGVGGLVGALVAANLEGMPRKGLLMLSGAAIMGVFLLLFSQVPIFGFALVLLAAANVGQMLFLSSNNTVVMAIVPEEVRGRVMSMLMMSFGIMPLGVVPIGFISDRYGPAAAITISSIGLLVVMALWFGLNSRMRNLRLDQLAHADMSRAQAAQLVADGKLTQEEADRIVRGEPVRRPSAAKAAG